VGENETGTGSNIVLHLRIQSKDCDETRGKNAMGRKVEPTIIGKQEEADKYFKKQKETTWQKRKIEFPVALRNRTCATGKRKKWPPQVKHIEVKTTKTQ